MCNALVPGPSPAFFDCSFAANHASNTDAAAAQQVCQSNGGVLKFLRTQSIGGGHCGYIVDKVACADAIICTGEPGGCAAYQGQATADTASCTFAWANPTDTDQAAAEQYCAAGNMGLVSFHRLNSYGGGGCGFIFDTVNCAPYTLGTLFPKYYILALAYAPPGCGNSQHGCSPSNYVDYSVGSSIGTATALEQSSGSGISVTAKFGTKDDNVGGGFDASTTDTNGISQTITRTQAGDLKIFGGEDGVNHNLDQFRILLNPAIFVAAVQNTVNWNMGWHTLPGINPPLMNAYAIDVYAYELKQNAAQMRPALKPYFQALGFTASDYATILAQDPYVTTYLPTPPSPRYALTTLSFTYEPPLDASICTGGVCQCNVEGGSLQNVFQTQTVASSQDTYKVTETANGSVPDIASFSVSGNITWSNKSTTTHTTSGTETASASISCPSAAYTGPISMAVYWDTLYGSFLFVPQGLTGQGRFHWGTIISEGKAIAHLPVELNVGGVVYRTTTNNKGEYTFYSSVIKPRPDQPVPATLTAGGVRQNVMLGGGDKTVIDLAGPVHQPGPVDPNTRESACLEGQTFIPGRGCVMQTRGCPQDTEMREGECVKQGPAPARYEPPYQEQQKPARIAPGQVVTPTAPPPPKYKPSAPVPNDRPIEPAPNYKPTAPAPNAKPIARPIDCRAPLVANSDGSACVCPQGTASRGGECVKTPGRAPSPK
jgi:hypothetical protein